MFILLEFFFNSIENVYFRENLSFLVPTTMHKDKMSKEWKSVGNITRN
jgi:hypothetical protein